MGLCVSCDSKTKKIKIIVYFTPISKYIINIGLSVLLVYTSLMLYNKSVYQKTMVKTILRLKASL